MNVNPLFQMLNISNIIMEPLPNGMTCICNCNNYQPGPGLCNYEAVTPNPNRPPLLGRQLDLARAGKKKTSRRL